MPGPKAAIRIQLSAQERQELQALLRRQKTPLGVARRARAVLLLEQGQSVSAAARQVGMARHHLRDWAQRFCQERLEGLLDRPRPGRQPVFSPLGGGASGQARLRDA